MQVVRKSALIVTIVVLSPCGMGGCSGQAERLPGEKASTSSTSAETQQNVDRATPSVPAKSRKKSKAQELSDEEWKRKAEQAAADVDAAQQKLEKTADGMEKNFAKIGKELNERRTAADAAAEKAKQEAFQRFDAATQPKPETTPVPEPDPGPALKP